MKKLISTSSLLLLLFSCGGPDNTSEETDGVGSNDHRVFITSSTVDGAMTGGTGSTGILKADDICSGLAENAKLTRTYKAIISTTDSNASERLVISGAIYIVAGSTATEIASSGSSLWNASVTNLKNPINRDENGTYLTNATIWTGSGEEGNNTSEDCNKWTHNTSGTYSGDYGSNDAVDELWIGNTSPDSNCSNSKHLYCISQ